MCIRALKDHFKVSALNGLGLQDYTIGVIAAGSIMQYLYETQKTSLLHLTKLTPYITSSYMLLDSSTRRNLELVETLREKQKRGSLLWVLDKTKTAMGARLLRTWIEQPLIDHTKINQRLDAIEELNQEVITREEIREYLNPVNDLERLIRKISYKREKPRNLIAFKASLEFWRKRKNTKLVLRIKLRKKNMKARFLKISKKKIRKKQQREEQQKVQLKKHKKESK